MPNPDQKEFFTPEIGKRSRAKGESAEDTRPTSGFRPLAARMRPRSLSEVVGQEHILGVDCLLPKLVRSDRFGSLLFYGPPGTGKTSLAQAIADETGSRFVQVNAVLSNTAEMRDILRFARHRPEDRTILFIDEIHRFNKAQQDLLLPDVEAGTIRLIGATTHNPGFYVIPPLLSRSHLFKLAPISEEACVEVLQKAIRDDRSGLGAMGMTAEPSVLKQLAKISDGDLRRALNALETLVLSLAKGGAITGEDVQQFANERQIRYDAGEDEHYDTISAFIKSMRGSDPDAALYWLAKMLLGGEDPRFIARRLVIFASEDIGLADSRALPLAVACKEACAFVGVPECELNLAHVTAYMATAPKSNSTTVAIARAKGSIQQEGLQPIPLWLRDAHTKFNKSQGHGQGYQYSHDYPEAISSQSFMEKPKVFYEPTGSGMEIRIKERLEYWKGLRK